jgi:hypothetical protein
MDNLKAEVAAATAVGFRSAGGARQPVAGSERVDRLGQGLGDEAGTG